MYLDGHSFRFLYMSSFFSTCSKHLSSRTWWLQSYRHLHHACSETQSACGFFQHLSLAKTRVMHNWSTDVGETHDFRCFPPRRYTFPCCLWPNVCHHGCLAITSQRVLADWKLAWHHTAYTSQLQESNQTRCQTNQNKPKRTTKQTNLWHSMTLTKITWAIIQHPILWSPSHLCSFPLRLKCHGIQSFKMCVSFDCRYLSINQRYCNPYMRWQVT